MWCYTRIDFFSFLPSSLVSDVIYEVGIFFWFFIFKINILILHIPFSQWPLQISICQINTQNNSLMASLSLICQSDRENINVTNLKMTIGKGEDGKLIGQNGEWLQCDKSLKIKSRLIVPLTL